MYIFSNNNKPIKVVEVKSFNLLVKHQLQLNMNGIL